ncbi:muconate/chloromuconate family cycloisomerase [Sphingobium fluviale]|uniref:Muconate cycloisomerase n=1 Tax=Sphingobium fluviale TaxID=2506423 RepID=A0A4Q1KNQ8_9SPHN|nr:muconate/chloromuconate family cycloisomerase [Sphingobium fluviale]RXR30474.1 muconate cycloisomerase [Sphingobium fluviale]
MTDSVRIERIEAILVDVPTIRPHVLSVATLKAQTMVIVRLYCADGIIGLGEATTIGGLAYGEESPEGIKLAIDTYLAPQIIGMDANRPAKAMAAAQAVAVGNRFAKSALEMALFDALGIRRGLPLSELLGGRLRDHLPVLWTLASGDTKTDIAEAEAMVAARRHKTFKLKIGKRPLKDDVDHVAAIKRALGDDVSIRVDVNQAWDEPTAKRGIAMLADAGCDLVEQPIALNNRAGMARLRASATIAIMADEALHGPTDAYAFASEGAADVLAVKISQAGGLRAARAMGEIADAAGVALYGGTMLEGPVGTAAAAHLFSTFPSLAFGTEQFGPLLLTEELLAEPLSYCDFGMAVPEGPGLGIALDDATLTRFRRDGPNRTVRPAPRAAGG